MEKNPTSYIIYRSDSKGYDPVKSMFYMSRENQEVLAKGGDLLSMIREFSKKGLNINNDDVITTIPAPFSRSCDGMINIPLTPEELIDFERLYYLTRQVD